MRHSIDNIDDDPLTNAIAPPPDETPQQRAARESAEAEARRVSDEIDELLRAERNAARKRKPPVKVLLLGQSESGKSTTLKNFQMQYAPDVWLRERCAWRAVVQLNLLRSINTLLNLLDIAMRAAAAADPPPAADPPAPPVPAPLEFTDMHRLLALRLRPLRGVQKDLERRIGHATEEPDPPDSSDALPSARRKRPQEFCVRSRDSWKDALGRLRARAGTSADLDQERREQEREERDDARVTGVLVGCCQDMQALWADGVMKEVLLRRRVRMEESPGFFLDDIGRIACDGYEPSDDDVVRARLRTVSVQEYSFTVDQGHDWVMYDVGGTRSARPHWFSYFDDMNAIIFLAPISAFDEHLTEDPKVNRLEDSYGLWRTLCTLKLLERTQIVLFLNKCDLLEKKLLAGVIIKDHVTSFGSRKNDGDTAKKYFQSHFKEIARQHSPSPRKFYVHLTSVVDTKATAVTLRTVQEGILRDSLRKADLL